MIVVTKGGKGSGNYGHAGRPGRVGGSAPENTPDLWGGARVSIAEDHLNRRVRAITEIAAAHYNDTFNSQGIAYAVKDRLVTKLSEQSGVGYNTVNDIIHQWANTSNSDDMRSLELQRLAAEEFGTKMSKWQKENYKYASAEYNEWKQYHELFDEAEAFHDEYSAMHPREEDEFVSDFYARENVAWRDIMGDDVPRLGKILTAAEDESSLPLNRRPITDEESQRKVLRAMYEETQRQLAEDFPGQDEITLYRGIKVNATIAKELEGHFNEDYTLDPGFLLNYKGNAMESWSVSESVARDFAFLIADDEWVNSENSGFTIAIKVPIRNILSTAVTGFGCLEEGEFVIIDNFPKTTARVVSNQPFMKP